MEKKKSLWIIIVILFLSLVSVSGYLFYDKLEAKKISNNEECKCPTNEECKCPTNEECNKTNCSTTETCKVCEECNSYPSNSSQVFANFLKQMEEIESNIEQHLYNVGQLWDYDVVSEMVLYNKNIYVSFNSGNDDLEKKYESKKEILSYQNPYYKISEKEFLKLYYLEPGQSGTSIVLALDTNGDYYAINKYKLGNLFSVEKIEELKNVMNLECINGAGASLCYSYDAYGNVNFINDLLDKEIQAMSELPNLE